MCGIIGVVNIATQEPIDSNRLLTASATMYHRGPDEGGVFTKSNVGMAIRRLSIIDVSGGHQPLSNEDNTIYIVYNGETYNYLDLRSELSSLGHRFSTHSDAEVVLHAYEQWGIEGCLERLRGMYAFAIWDDRTQSLLLGRDRMGIKPLYFAEYDGRLYFSSEIRGMLLYSNMSRNVNLMALDVFMTVGFVTSPDTLFKGVSKLPPAHYLMAKDGQVSVHKYWQLSYEATNSRSDEETAETFYELMRESVELRLMSEVPLGALISGGIDSTTVAALAQRITHAPLKTVSIGFENAGYDETAAATVASKALGTDHHTIIFSGDSMDNYPQAMYRLEEPLALPIFCASYNLYQACRQLGLTVVLTGEGADELLAGYHWHRGDIWARPFLRLPYPLRAILAKQPLLHARGEAGMSMGRVLKSGLEPVHERYKTWLKIGDNCIKNNLLSADVKSALDGYSDQSFLKPWVEHLSTIVDQPEYDQMLWLQSRTRMVDLINHWADRMSMAHSVEARPIFLDHKLWEFCATVPYGLKLRGTYFRLTEKYLLREATRDLVPESTRLRKKKGLSVPHGDWLTRPRLPDWAETALSVPQLRNVGLFAPKAVLTLRKEHQAGAPGRATLLMGVLAVQVWARIFLDPSPSTPCF